MKRNLVTGAKGFIGSHLVAHLRQRGVEAMGIDRARGDVTEPGTFIGGDLGGIDKVVHLAGRSYVPESWTRPAEFYQTNVMGTVNVLEYCRRVGASLTFVSAYLYGVPDQLPIDENAAPRPNSPYAQSKFLAEELCRFYTNEFGVETKIVRPFNVYGSGQRADFLIPGIVAQALDGEVIRVKDLRPRRDYVYVTDMVEALGAILDKGRAGEVYNVGSGNSSSVAEVVEEVQKLLGSAKSVMVDEQPRKNEIPDVIADITKIGTHTGWSPTISITDGLARLIEYMRSLPQGTRISPRRC